MAREESSSSLWKVETVFHAAEGGLPSLGGEKCVLVACRSAVSPDFWLALASAGYGRAGAGARAEKPSDRALVSRRTRTIGTAQMGRPEVPGWQTINQLPQRVQGGGGASTQCRRCFSLPRCEFRTQPVPAQNPASCPGRQTPHSSHPPLKRIPSNPEPWSFTPQLGAAWFWHGRRAGR